MNNNDTNKIPDEFIPTEGHVEVKNGAWPYFWNRNTIRNAKGRYWADKDLNATPIPVTDESVANMHH